MTTEKQELPPLDELCEYQIASYAGEADPQPRIQRAIRDCRERQLLACQSREAAALALVEELKIERGRFADVALEMQNKLIAAESQISNQELSDSVRERLEGAIHYVLDRAIMADRRGRIAAAKMLRAILDSPVMGKEK